MSNYSDPITETGSLITFDAPSGGVFDSLSVPITPTQELNGYEKPWPAGGGVNLFDPDNLNTVTVNGADRWGHKYTNPGTYAIKAYATGSSAYLYARVQNADSTWQSINYVVGGNTTTPAIVTITSGQALFVYDAFAHTKDASSELFNERKLQVALSSTQPDQYYPYENICPISGIDSLSVYVSPTTQQAQATEYAVSFGSTVYAGFADPITGEVKERPQYPSYNGEVLVGPWLSSMDEYAVGVTPTTGAQVVDLGGALATASITPVDISMRTGSNNVWVDTSAIITLIYRLLQVDRQTGATSIGRLAQNLLIANQFGAYSKVILNVTDELYYEAGNETGRTLELNCPFGTQAMANNILAMLEGFQYQPYTAERAILDPAAELGDGLTVNGVYGGILRLSIKSGAVYNADVSAPADEEIDHEYAFIPNAERKIERRINNISSELSVQAGEIAAKVDREGGDPSSVSWTMDADVFKVAVDGSDVLTVDENGLTVNGNGSFTGEVQAKNIKYGGSNGTFSGGGISGGSIGTSKFTSGINVSLGNADYSADVFSGAATATYTKAKNLYCIGEFRYNGIRFGSQYATVVTPTGNKNIYYLGYL